MSSRDLPHADTAAGGSVCVCSMGLAKPAPGAIRHSAAVRLIISRRTSSVKNGNGGTPSGLRAVDAVGLAPCGSPPSGASGRAAEGTAGVLGGWAEASEADEGWAWALTEGSVAGGSVGAAAHCILAFVGTKGVPPSVVELSDGAAAGADSGFALKLRRGGGALGSHVTCDMTGGAAHPLFGGPN